MPRFTKLFIPVIFFLLPAFLHAQDSTINNKIDLPFRILIANQKTTLSVTKKKSASSKSCGTSKHTVSTTEKKYECIIHTSDVAKLRQMGIVVQTETPRAVTALATLSQIKQAAALSTVQFIEAPEQLRLHND